MSRHQFHGLADGTRPVRVVSGYDRRLGEFFLNVIDLGDDAEEDFLFVSLGDRDHDWRSVDAIELCLGELHVPAPDSLLASLAEDWANNVGNRVVEHFFDAPPAVLLG